MGQETVTVDITAEAKVRLSKVVKMSMEDYEEYLLLLNSDLDHLDLEEAITKIADKYNFGYESDICDMYYPEEITFEALGE